MNTKFVIIGAIVVLAALAVGYSVGLSHNNVSFGTSGVTNFTQVDAKSGFLVNGTSVINSLGQYVYGISTAQPVTISGSATFASTTAVSQSASSTLKIGNNASGLGSGCLVLGDSGGATSTPVYITATGATVSATTTKPAICQ